MNFLITRVFVGLLFLIGISPVLAQESLSSTEVATEGFVVNEPENFEKQDSEIGAATNVETFYTEVNDPAVVEKPKSNTFEEMAEGVPDVSEKSTEPGLSFTGLPEVANQTVVVVESAEEPISVPPSLTINLSNIKSDSGVLKVGVFNSKETYETKGVKPIIGRTFMAAFPTATLTIEDVPAGTYAIKLYQDENNNGKMDMGFKGPKEPYSFSNNAFRSFGPPLFAEASFEVTDDGAVIDMRLKN